MITVSFTGSPVRMPAFFVWKFLKDCKDINARKSSPQTCDKRDCVAVVWINVMLKYKNRNVLNKTALYMIRIYVNVI